MSTRRFSEMWQWGVIITAILVGLLSEFKGEAQPLTPDLGVTQSIHFHSTNK